MQTSWQLGGTYPFPFNLHPESKGLKARQNRCLMRCLILTALPNYSSNHLTSWGELVHLRKRIQYQCNRTKGAGIGLNMSPKEQQFFIKIHFHTLYEKHQFLTFTFLLKFWIISFFKKQKQRKKKSNIKSNHFQDLFLSESVDQGITVSF
jgi:hypothetical protein